MKQANSVRKYFAHPNIIAVYDVGLEDGTTFLVSELLRGRTLRDVLKKGPVPAKTAIDYARQVVSGLAAAHDRAILRWFDSGGNDLGRAREPAYLYSPVLSPDAARVSVTERHPSSARWAMMSIDLDRDVATREVDLDCSLRSRLWSPDGAHVAGTEEPQGIVTLLVGPSAGGSSTPVAELTDFFPRQWPQV